MIAPARFLGAAEIAAAVRSGAVAPEAFVARALDDVARTDASLRAWVCTDAGAVDAARAVDRAKPLAGVPFGVKDVIDVRGMPTRHGVEFSSSEPAFADAWCVAAVRNAGAVPIGKTETTAFAYSSHPAPTYSAWNLERTPGGSSAGSGAAVGAGIVPFAFGTQTGGSTLRPASYNGVAGFKPTFGRVPTAGIGALAPSADHAGIIARTVADLELLLTVLDPSFEPARGERPMRVLCDAGYHRELTREDGREVLRRIAAQLAGAAVSVEAGALPGALAEVDAVWSAIVPFEAYATLGPIVAGTPGRPLLHERVQSGARIAREAYVAAFRKREQIRAAVDGTLETFDAFMVLTAGPTPTRETTGNQQTQMVRSWTILGNPSISVPGGLDADGLPVGIQLIARRGNDAALLQLARRVESVAQFRARPQALPV